MNLRGLGIGIILIIIIGTAGFLYRNALEHPQQPITCPLDTETCPDGTSVSRIGTACVFPACPAPNVTLKNLGISYAVPKGFADAPLPDGVSVAAYARADATTTSTSSPSTDARIIIRRYSVDASTTALAVTEATALGAASGMPVPITAYSSTVSGNHRFTVVPIEQFEGVVDTAYYLPYDGALLRFDAIDTGVANWNDPHLDVSALPAEQGLSYLLSTLQ